MRVKLRRTWFGPNGFRYRPLAGGVEVPNALEKYLPSDAIKLDGKGEPVAKKGEEPVALSQLSSTVNPPVDPDLQQVSEGEAVTRGNHVPQASKTGSIFEEDTKKGSKK